MYSFTEIISWPYSTIYVIIYDDIIIMMICCCCCCCSLMCKDCKMHIHCHSLVPVAVVQCQLGLAVWPKHTLQYRDTLIPYTCKDPRTVPVDRLAPQAVHPPRVHCGLVKKRTAVCTAGVAQRVRILLGSWLVTKFNSFIYKM